MLLMLLLQFEQTFRCSFRRLTSITIPVVEACRLFLIPDHLAETKPRRLARVPWYRKAGTRPGHRRNAGRLWMVASNAVGGGNGGVEGRGRRAVEDVTERSSGWRVGCGAGCVASRIE